MNKIILIILSSLFLQSAYGGGASNPNNLLSLLSWLKTSTGFYYPTNAKHASSPSYYHGFGDVSPYFNQRCHMANDYKAKEGDPVVAIGDGEVVKIKTDEPYYGGTFGEKGGLMIIKHKTADSKVFYAVYAHIKGIKLHVGDRVNAKQIIAVIGPYNGGNNKPFPHLHFSISTDDSALTYKWGYTPTSACKDYMGFVDPEKFMLEHQAPSNKPLDTEKPSIPHNLTTSNITINSITLNWNKSTDNVGVSGYEVHYNDKIKTVSSNSATLTGLTPNMNYSIRVKAKDAAGNKSGFSNFETAVTDSKIITPTFTLEYIASSGGRIEGSSTQTIKKGESAQAVTAVAHSGFKFIKWSDGSRSTKRTDKNIDQNLMLTATFANNTPVCTQVLTPAWNIKTGDEKIFPDSCIPDGWKLGKAPDYDKDGIPDVSDNDDDGDNVLDVNDAFPFNTAESVDTDKDGTGNNADTDDDGDGYSDAAEKAAGTDPLNATDMPSSESDITSDKENEAGAGSFPIGLLMLGLLAFLRRK